MNGKPTFAEVVKEARAQMERWPESMKKLEEYRRAEERKHDQAQLAESDQSSFRE
jgi:hypothetical protein